MKISHIICARCVPASLFHSFHLMFSFTDIGSIHLRAEIAFKAKFFWNGILARNSGLKFWLEILAWNYRLKFLACFFQARILRRNFGLETEILVWPEISACR